MPQSSTRARTHTHAHNTHHARQPTLIRAQTSVQSIISDFLSLDILVTSMSVIALMLVYNLLYAPFLLRLNMEIKAVRGLLLLFPDDLASNLGSLQDLLLLQHGHRTFSADELKSKV